MGAGRPKSIDNNKVFDISKPNKSRPMGTSRPVIVNHGAMVKDPVVIDVDGAAKKPETMSPPSVTRKIISPMSDKEPKKPAEPEAVAATTAPAVETAPEAAVETTITASGDNKPSEVEGSRAEDTEASVPEADVKNEDEAAGTDEKTEPDSEEVKPEEEAAEKPEENSAETPETSEAAAVDVLAEVSQNKKTENKELAEEAKRDAALQQLIDSKKYVVPLAHDSSKRSGGKGALVILLVLILLAAGAYLAIDAKLIDVNVNLPYHFFPQ